MDKVEEDRKACRAKLAHPPPDVRSRLVVLQNATLDQYQVDSLGLSLKIEA